MKSAYVVGGALALWCLATPGAHARDARCTVHEYRTTPLDGPCNFEPDGRDGSFTLLSRRTGAPLYGDVVMISVSMISPGVAEVRGLTRAGVNSRWGEARRSNENRACWTGADFQVCAL